MLTAGAVRGLLELDDRMTATLNAAAANAQAKFAGLARSAKQSGEDMASGFTGKLATLETSLDSVGNKMRGAGMTMTAAFTLPIVGALGMSVKAAMDFESSFAGVRKTVNASEPELLALAAGFRKMATEIPVSVNELNKIGESAGQLGIETKHILGFSRVMADLGVTTNLSSEEAATSLARLANITGMPKTQFDRLGSTIVGLGNNMATTEKEIVEFGLRIAGAGKIAGLSEAEILSIGAAMSSVGVEAEAGGTSVQKMLLSMTEATATGNKDLAVFASTAGMSSKQFATAFEKDAAGAFAAFTIGLGKQGISAISTLDQLGLSDERLKRSFLALGGAGDELTKSLRIGTTAWAENTALTKEAEQRYATTDSQLKILWNRITDVAITIGLQLLPILIDAVKAMTPLIAKVEGAVKWFGGLPGPVKLTALAFLGIVALTGPFLIFFGMMATGFSSIIGLSSTMIGGLGKLEGALLKTLAKDPFSPQGIASGKLLTKMYQGQTLFVTALGVATKITAGAINLMARAWLIAIGPIGITIGIIAALALGIRYLTGSWDFLVVPMKVAWVLLKDLGALIGAALTDAVKTFGNVLSWLRDQFVAALDPTWLKNQWNEIGAVFSWAGSILDKFFDFKWIKSQISELVGALGTAISWLKEAWSWMKRVADFGTTDVSKQQSIAADRLMFPHDRAATTLPPIKTGVINLNAPGGGETGVINLNAPGGGGGGGVDPDKLAAGAKKAADAAEKMREEIRKLNAELTGSNALDDYAKLVKALPPLHQLSADALGRVSKTLADSIGYYERQGKVAPAEMRKTALEVTKLQHAHGIADAAAKAYAENTKFYAEQAAALSAAGDARMRTSLSLSVSLGRETQDALFASEKDSLDKRKRMVEADFTRRINDLDKTLPMYKQHHADLVNLQQDATNRVILDYHRQNNALEYAMYDAQDHYYKISQAAGSSAEDVSKAFVEMNRATAAYKGQSADFISTLAGGFQKLAEIAGGTAGKILKSTGSILSGLATAQQSNIDFTGSANKGFGIANALFAGENSTRAEKWGSAIASAGAIANGAMEAFAAGATAANKSQAALGGAMAGAKAGAVFGTPGIAIGAAAGAIMGLVGAANAGRKAMQEFYASFTSSEGIAGMAGLRGELLRLGAEGETLWVNLTQKTGKGDLAAAEAAIKAIKDALAALDADVKRYNLTWTDHADAQSAAADAGDALALSYQRLTADGYASDAVLRGMSNDINAFIGNALRAGTTIPAGMQPIIQSLIEQGLLTEANARLMLGLGEDTMPTLADIKAAADRYGLSLDALGPKVAQLQLTEAASQIVKDWNILTSAGADVGVLFEKMGDEIQGMVNQALTAGLALPESMRPMLESLATAGLLTDAAGNQLTDLSGITFEESLGKQIDRLVAALQSFVDAINGPTTDALDRLGRTQVRIKYGFDHDGSTIRDPNEDIEIDAPGFAGGTGGRLRDFGAGTLVELHGKERVQTEAEFNAERAGGGAPAAAAMASKLDDIKDLLRRQPALMQIAIRDGILQAQ